MLMPLLRHRIALGALLFLWNSSAIFADTLVAPFPNGHGPADAILYVEGRWMPDAGTPFWRRVVSREPKHQELAGRAQLFVNAVISKWSGTNPDGLAGFDALYAAEIDYFGKRLTRAAVLADKRRFAKRWPERIYKVQSSYAECNASECVVDGSVEWETRSPARKAMASGIAGFSYVLMPLGETFVIKRESGNVRLRQNPTSSQPGSAVAKEARPDEPKPPSQPRLTVTTEAQPDEPERPSQPGSTVAKEVQLDEPNPPSQPRLTVTREAQLDERERPSQGSTVAKEAQPDEREGPSQIGFTVAREAQSDERKPPSQLRLTVATEAQPGEQEADLQLGFSLTAFLTRLHLVDFQIVCAAAILVGLLLWRAVNWGWRKSETKAEAQTKRQAEQEAEQQREAKQNHTSPREGPWDRDQPGLTGPRIPPEAQQRDTEQEAEWRGQEQEREAEGRRQREAERRRREAAQRENERRRRQAEREAERQRQWECEHPMKEQTDEWWNVLEVSSDASKDEIVCSYRRKIQRCHPDRVSGLAQEFVSLAESRTKALNAAYSEAMRACHAVAQQP
jgi:DnaJ-domain-containing protein 1